MKKIKTFYHYTNMKTINNHYRPDYQYCLDNCNDDMSVFYDLVCDEQELVQETYKELEKGVKTVRLWQAVDIFKDDLKMIIKSKKGYERSKDKIWDRIEKMISDDNNIDLQKAKLVPIDRVCKALNIELKRNRATTPFVKDANNQTAFIAKNGFYKCFRTDKSGDNISLVQEITGKNFKAAVNFINSL